MTTETELNTLEAKGLVRLATYHPELEYLFRHWLVQDAAYGSLLKQERRELHRRVGDALEALYPERRDELAGVLALHFEQAGEVDKALDYLVAAGRYALDRNALREAFSSFDRAAGLLASAPPSDDAARRRRHVEIELGRTRASWAFRPIDDLVDDLDAILPDAERVGDADLLAELHLQLALTRLMRGETAAEPAVRRSLDRITELGATLGDPSLRAMPLALVGLMEVFGGPIRKGVASLEEAVPLMERRQDFIGAAFARGALAIGYASLGEFDRAEAAADNAVELAGSGDLIAQLDARIAKAWVRSARGQLDEAVPLAQACIDQAEDAGATACVMASSWLLGDVFHRQGRFSEARAVLQRGTDVSLVVDRKVWRPTLQSWLGSTEASLGDVPGGDFDEALATARSIHNTVGEAGILQKRGEAAATRGDFEAAVTDFAASAAIAEAEGARPALARTLRAEAASLRAAGRREDSGPVLRRALDLFAEMGLAAEADAVRAELATG